MVALGQAAQHHGVNVVHAIRTVVAPLGHAALLAGLIADTCALFARAVEVGREVEAAPLKDRRELAARLFD